MSTGREAAKEHQEIPPTLHMEKQAKQGKTSGGVVMPEETQSEPGKPFKEAPATIMARNMEPYEVRQRTSSETDNVHFFRAYAVAW